MPFIYIDRRKASKGKSSSNRQKLIRRVKSFIKSSDPQNIGTGSISGSSNTTSPVKVAGKALEEPRFAYAKDGDHTAIIIGNTEYDRGDEIEVPESDEQASGAGPGDAGEDDFIINIAKDEFLDLYFEDCELPNLTNEKYTEKLDNSTQPAGFSTSGNPSQLSVVRTYKQSIGRRRALSGPYLEEKEELEAEFDVLEAQLEELQSGGTSSGSMLDDQIGKRMAEITQRLEEIDARLISLLGFDKSDLRYRKKEAKPLKTVDAVLVMLMDISGSMDQNKKTIARRWFTLLYAFIKRRYANTELVFIAHTDEVFEMDESSFFSTKVNGGTQVSPALKRINEIIKERYDPAQTNIYVSHASDGDNWSDDEKNVIEEMVGAGSLLSKVQYFSYVEVGKRNANSWYSSVGGSSTQDTNLWEGYSESRDKSKSKNISLAIIETPDSCYSTFKKVFKKEKK